jgi:hypothetical protein
LRGTESAERLSVLGLTATQLRKAGTRAPSVVRQDPARQHAVARGKADRVSRTVRSDLEFEATRDAVGGSPLELVVPDSPREAAAIAVLGTGSGIALASS